MKTCFLSIDVEKREKQEEEPFIGVERLDNILNIFKKHWARATLFVTGEVLERYPDLAKKWAEDFEIGCHNYYHIEPDRIDPPVREKQIKDFIKIYTDIFNRNPNGFRAPRNAIDSGNFESLEKIGFIYDSSVLPRYPLAIKHYTGYRGRAPINPYWPSKENYRREGPSIPLGTSNKLLEIPESPVVLGVPLVGTWLRKLGAKFFKFLFLFKKPDFVSFSMHSWDGVEFRGRGSKNSGKMFLNQLDEMLAFLKRAGYEFKSGIEIYEQFSKNK